MYILISLPSVVVRISECLSSARQPMSSPLKVSSVLRWVQESPRFARRKCSALSGSPKSFAFYAFLGGLECRSIEFEKFRNFGIPRGVWNHFRIFRVIIESFFEFLDRRCLFFQGTYIFVCLLSTSTCVLMLIFWYLSSRFFNIYAVEISFPLRHTSKEL